MKDGGFKEPQEEDDEELSSCSSSEDLPAGADAPTESETESSVVEEPALRRRAKVQFSGFWSPVFTSYFSDLFSEADSNV